MPVKAVARMTESDIFNKQNVVESTVHISNLFINNF
jgi:hypothetical protein